MSATGKYEQLNASLVQLASEVRVFNERVAVTAKVSRELEGIAVLTAHLYVSLRTASVRDEVRMRGWRGG